MANAVRDLQLDPETNELVIVGGAPVLLSGADALAQSLRVRLRFIKGEWFLDLDAGMDFAGKVIGKHSRETALAEIRRVIRETPGVADILRLEADFSQTTRTLSVRWSVATDYGVLNGAATSQVT